MSWLEKLIPSKSKKSGEKKGVPEGLWFKCDACQEVLFKEDFANNLFICPKCGHHHRIPARKRLLAFLDAEGCYEIGQHIRPLDPLKFKDSKPYPQRLADAEKATGESEALIVMSGSVLGVPVVAGAFEFAFMGGSMGSVVGERFVRAVRTAIAEKKALVVFAASGGARMQEGLLALMQMAKTSAALTRLAAARLPFISILTDPTMGGVSASFATLGDIIIAEPKALIGFAGPRVIEQTVRQTLPEGFQRAEFLLEHGAIDAIVDRRQMRDYVAAVIAAFLHRPVVSK